MAPLIPELFMRSLEDLDIEDLCQLLEITHEDIIRRFRDKIYEKGLDSSVDMWYTDDELEELDVDLNEELDDILLLDDDERDGRPLPWEATEGDSWDTTDNRKDDNDG